MAFSLNDLKPSRKSLPHLVVTVPPSSEEKRVKMSKTPLILKYLKNNWIWHNKNGSENCTSSPLSRKRRRTTPTERDDDSSNSGMDDTPERSRFRPSEPVEERGLENEHSASTSIISALDETAANEGREVIIHHFRHEFLTRQLENREEPSTSATNECSSSINLNTCMVAREIEEEQRKEEEKDVKKNEEEK
uniref:Uncharacterized protein n=1 Tax=Meloidogyne hapla TaxID=6305 RepID=A0A1I8BR10_MELHA